MNRIFFLTVSLLCISSTLFGQYSTTADGNWQDGATWGGSAPNNLNLNSNTTINHKVVLVGDLHLTAQITLTVNDVLIIYGNVYMDNNKSKITLSGGGSLLVYGTFTVDNPNQVVLVSGDLLITGLLTITNSQGHDNINIQGGGRVFATGGIAGSSVSGKIYETLPSDPNDPINVIDGQYELTDFYVMPASIEGCDGELISVVMNDLLTHTTFLGLDIGYSIVVKKNNEPDIVLVDKVSQTSIGAVWRLDKNYNGGTIVGEEYISVLGTWIMWNNSYNESSLLISTTPTTGIIQRVP